MNDKHVTMKIISDNLIDKVQENDGKKENGK